MENFEDIYLELNSDGIYDIVIENGDIKLDKSFDSSIIAKIGTDGRVSDKIISDPIRRSGWVGNLYFDNIANEFISEVWISGFSRDIKSKLSQHIKNALKSFLDDGTIKNIDVNIVHEGQGIYSCNILYSINDINTNKVFLTWSETRWH